MALTRDEMAAILQAVRNDMRRPETRPRQYRPTASTTLGILIGRTSTGGISARSTGDVAGIGTVTICQMTTGGAISASSQTVVAYNIASQSIGGSQLVQLKQEMMSGRFIVDFEDCTT